MIPQSNHDLTLVLFAAFVLGFFLRYLWLWQKNKPRGVDPNTQRYARACYHNGLISMEELQRFCETHPEDENGNSLRRRSK